MKVPLLDLKLQYKEIKEEIEKKLPEIFESQMLVLGPEVEKLEKTLAEYSDCKYAVGVSSGTDALLMALMALDIGPGDEVIVPTYSFFATAGVVARLHAIPVFVDSEIQTFNIDPKLIEEKITPKTKAIIPVHLYGQAAGMEEILKIAGKHNIPVIEDAAQAIGTQYQDGRKAGSMGLMGCFSFYPTKNLGGFGDGGIITTNDEKLSIKLRQMRNHGMEPKYYHKFVGGNFRLDAIQAAVLNIKFPYLAKWHESRRNNAVKYNTQFIAKGLAEAEGIIRFNDKNRVLLPAAVYRSGGAENYHIYNQYIIRVNKRDELRKYLADNGIGSEIYYPVPFHRQECFESMIPSAEKFPVADMFAEETLALPIFPELTEEQIEYTVKTIADFIEK